MTRAASVIGQFSFRCFIGFFRFLPFFSVSGDLKPGDWETHSLDPNVHIESPELRTNYHRHSEYNLTPTNKLVGMMVNIMVDKI
jgi:hypothetical protein